MSLYFRIFCETDSQWEYDFSQTALTTCPTNGAHTINSNSVSLIKPRYEKDFTLNLQYNKNKLETDIYTELISFLYLGEDYIGILKKIEITFSMDKNGNKKTGSTDFGFYLRLRDITNDLNVIETSQVPGNEIIITQDVFTPNANCDNSPATWSIGIKKAQNAGNLNIRHIRLLFF